MKGSQNGAQRHPRRIRKHPHANETGRNHQVTTHNTKKGRANSTAPFHPELRDQKLAYPIRMQTRQAVKHGLNHGGIASGPQTGRVPVLPHTPQRL